MQKNMTQNWQPANYNTIDPYIPVKGAAAFIEFLKKHLMRRKIFVYQIRMAP
jgi:hypothetical protein